MTAATSHSPHARPGRPSKPIISKVRELHLRKLFADDPERGERMTAEAVGIYLDYSKNRVTDETLKLLLQLAEESGLRARIDAMFRGEKINITENRAVLHVALRAPEGRIDRRRRRERRARGPRRARQDGRLLQPGAQRRLEGPHRQAHPQRRQHRHRRLGPRAGDGLRGAASITASATMTFRFVSNVDGTDFAEATRDLDPAETLFIVSSKTFTTLETMTNAHTARDWSLEGLGGDEKAVAKHFVAVSTNAAKVSRSSASTPPTCSASGTGSAGATRWTRRSASRRCSPSARRTSAPCSTASTRWTSISAPRPSSRTCRCYGPAGRLVQRLLRRADRGRPALRAVPEALSRLPAAVDDGEQRQARHARRRPRSTTQTGPIYWGEPGTNGQHSFYQLIHQGTRLIPCDFIALLPSR